MSYLVTQLLHASCLTQTRYVSYYHRPQLEMLEHQMPEMYGTQIIMQINNYKSE